MDKPASESSGYAYVGDVSKKIRVIHLNGLTLLKIIKHCSEALPTIVAGSLLGLETSGDALEVTNCFPFPAAGEEDDVDADGQMYQMEMMKMLREVNVDNNCVGWYQSTYLGAFCTTALIETQFDYQNSLGPNAVCIAFDPLKTAKGHLSVRAYRLTDAFMDQYRRKEFTQEALSKAEMSAGKMFEEIPIKLHNSHLVNCFLYEMKTRNESKVEFDRLDLSSNPYLEKNVEFLMSWLDDYITEQGKFRYYEYALQRQKLQQQQWLAKRKEENKVRRANGEEPLPEEDPEAFKPVAEPSRLESLLMSHQISSYCNQINRFCGQSFQKLFLAGSLQKE